MKDFHYFERPSIKRIFRLILPAPVVIIWRHCNA